LGGILLLTGSRLTGQIATFSSGIDVVEVYATVTDGDGRPVSGLTAADFQIAEDGTPQTVAMFAAGKFPLSIAIALDRSFSMTGERLALSKQAARSFVEALRPDDEVMVLAIGSEVELITPLAPVREAAAVAWEKIDAWGTTPLYDAGVQALDAIQARRGRRALLLVSDGVDRGSRTPASELIAHARESGVLVYPVAIGGTRPPVFGELANVTGGRSFFIDDPRRLEAQLVLLARELRAQYFLGYTPSRPTTAVSGARPQWRTIQVTVSRAGARVRARDGYLVR
jgi:Ca-activated chloride channel family protein